MAKTVKAVLDRIKNLNEFEIKTELPDGFAFNGAVPYDIKIKENTATFTLYALDAEEAAEKVNQYLSENTEY
jgi:phage FluMu protein gp41